MVFRDLVLPSISTDGNKPQSLKAALAEIGEPRHLLRIQGLEFSFGVPASGFSLGAPTATLDLKTKAIHAPDGFTADGWGFSFEGANLAGSVAERSFEISGYFQVKTAGRSGGNAVSTVPARVPNPQAFEFRLERQSIPRVPDPMTGLRLLQGFSPHLHGFEKYWRHLSREPGEGSNRWDGNDWHLVSWQGGAFDMQRQWVRMTGHSALIGPGGFLSSRGGMVWSREKMETGDDAIETRVEGGGGVNVWMQDAGMEVTWLKSESFVYVADMGDVLQFEGGPVRFFRDGIEFQATEDWQFVRLFDGGRLVLSPGSWNTTSMP